MVICDREHNSAGELRHTHCGSACWKHCQLQLAIFFSRSNISLQNCGTLSTLRPKRNGLAGKHKRQRRKRVKLRHSKLYWAGTAAGMQYLLAGNDTFMASSIGRCLEYLTVNDSVVSVVSSLRYFTICSSPMKRT
ncbi:hypothetical protein NPIL_439951 [Nephila pilipes]|uniref:Uncharacterized protein n=1 Tax=Nephila pilipes TaxID=299642 RepID=A0A8X6THL6_NEPPI|nr:hypothetical protein NPIL_439951 [Nephila pilipes]